MFELQDVSDNGRAASLQVRQTSISSGFAGSNTIRFRLFRFVLRPRSKRNSSILSVGIAAAIGLGFLLFPSWALLCRSKLRLLGSLVAAFLARARLSLPVGSRCGRFRCHGEYCPGLKVYTVKMEVVTVSAREMLVNCPPDRKGKKLQSPPSIEFFSGSPVSHQAVSNRSGSTMLELQSSHHTGLDATRTAVILPLGAQMLRPPRQP